MSVKLLIDMNLSPEWVAELARHGWTAVHWSTVGDPRAEDDEIMAWAVSNGHCVFTHDLGFGTTLALTHSTAPSVIQVRGRAILPEDLAQVVAGVLREHGSELETGALVVVELKKARVRVLPL